MKRVLALPLALMCVATAGAPARAEGPVPIPGGLGLDPGSAALAGAEMSTAMGAWMGRDSIERATKPQTGVEETSVTPVDSDGSRRWWDWEYPLSAKAADHVDATGKPVATAEAPADGRRRWWDWEYPVTTAAASEQREEVVAEIDSRRRFWDWEYPVTEETVNDADAAVPNAAEQVKAGERVITLPSRRKSYNVAR